MPRGLPERKEQIRDEFLSSKAFLSDGRPLGLLCFYQEQREWMGIEPTSPDVNRDSTALKAAGPTRRPDTPGERGESTMQRPFALRFNLCQRKHNAVPLENYFCGLVHHQ